MLEPDELAELTRAIRKKVLEQIQLPEVHPATVQTVNADGTVTVVLDIDKDASPAVTVTVAALVAGLVANDRVMVMHQPPRAGFVLGVIQG